MEIEKLSDWIHDWQIRHVGVTFPKETSSAVEMAKDLLQGFQIEEKKSYVSIPEDWKVVAYFDGNGGPKCSRPGRAQYLIEWPNGQMTPGCREYPVSPETTNNFLEYNGLIECLTAIIGIASKESGDPLMLSPNFKSTLLIIRGDSQLVINQSNGTWRVKEPSLVPLRDNVIKLLGEVKQYFASVKLEWVPSEQNKVDAHA